MLLPPLKRRALNGHHDKLPPRELEFVGVSRARPPDVSGGWHQPSDSSYELGSWLPPEDAELLQALMNVGRQDRLEFLSG